jgi:hypothetical protein
MLLRDLLRQMGRFVPRWLKSGRGIAVTAIGLLAGLVRAFAWEEATGATRKLAKVLPDLARVPIGYFGLALLVWIAFWCAFVILLAFLVTRPRLPWVKALGEKRDLEQQLKAISKERDEYHEQGTSWFQKVNFGTPFPKLQNLGEHDRPQAVNLAIDLTTKLEEALTPAEMIWSGELNAWAVTEPCASWLYNRVKREEFQHLKAALNTLSRSVRTAPDPRPLLTVTYMAYHRWRVSMKQFDRLHPLRNSPQYREWYEADARLRDHFKRLTNYPQFAEVGREARRFHEENGVEVELPEVELPPP